MDANSLLGRALRPFAICAELARMPVARLRFDRALDPDFIRATHANFTRPHPRFKVFGNKTMGAALIDLAGLAGPGD